MKPAPHLEARRRRGAARDRKAARLTIEGECACGVAFIVRGPETQRVHLHAVFLAGTTKHRSRCDIAHLLVTEAKGSAPP